MAIERFYTFGNAFAGHSAGDVLVAFIQSATQPNAPFIELSRYTTTWQYDTHTSAYLVAPSSGNYMPFGVLSPLVRLTGVDTSNPIAGVASGQGTAWSDPGSLQIPSVPTPEGGLRLTFITGYGGGGNPWNGGSGATVTGGDPPTTKLYQNNYAILYEGGVGGFTSNVSPGYAGGNRSWVTVSFNPAKTSGFFAMF